DLSPDLTARIHLRMDVHVPAPREQISYVLDHERRGRGRTVVLPRTGRQRGPGGRLDASGRRGMEVSRCLGRSEIEILVADTEADLQCCGVEGHERNPQGPAGIRRYFLTTVEHGSKRERLSSNWSC